MKTRIGDLVPVFSVMRRLCAGYAPVSAKCTLSWGMNTERVKVGITRLVVVGSASRQ